MVSILKNNRRMAFVICLMLISFLLATVFIEFNFELAVISSFFLTLAITLYYPITHLLAKKKSIIILPSRIKKEHFIVSIIIAFILLFGAIESYPDFMIATVIFSELSIALFVYSYLKFKYKSESKSRFPFLHHWSLYKSILWFLGISCFVLIVVLTIYEYEPIVNLLAFIYFTILFAFGIRWTYRQMQHLYTLRNEKTKTELLHLQSQVNPHFFFNMLNNLYALVEEDSKKAQDVILKLSDMMRYGIYDGQKEVVSINDEIEYINTYLDLHKLRYHKKIETTFDYNIKKECNVMPLMYIILVENAFKHGVERLRKDAFVHIKLFATTKKVVFTIENNFDSEEYSTDENEQKGIGLKNLKRRLELFYPGKHHLVYGYNGNIYHAHLSLALS